jgi:hypothetical protein
MEHAAVQSPFGEAKNPSTVFTHGHETDLLTLHDKGVGLLLHQQGLGTTSSAGKAMFQMLGVFAEFEQGIIRQRVNSASNVRFYPLGFFSEELLNADDKAEANSFNG